MSIINYILEELKQLTAIDSPTGFTAKAAGFVIQELSIMGYSPVLTNKGGVLCELGGSGDDGLLLLAHLDTLGGMVQTVKENGRLKLTRVGGLMPQNTETETVRVYTYDGRKYTGTFQLENASIHVNTAYKTTERSFDTMEVVLDEQSANRAETAALGIEAGNFVCFEPRTIVTETGYIKSRFLDDKLSVATLLGFAKQLKEEALALPRKTWMHITVYEEVGHGAAGTVPAGVAELLAADMGCVGEGLSCTERQVSICVKDSAGPCNYEMTTKLIRLAKENGIAYAADVYPSYGSDADCAMEAGYDCRHALIGAGVYASHGYERAHVDGVKNALALIRAYVLAGN